MKTSKFYFLIIAVIVLSGCAASYTVINPDSINYIANDTKEGISLEYKYDLLKKKLSRKEVKKGVKLVAVKITNYTEEAVVFGKDIKLTYENGNELYIMDNDEVYRALKQIPATYLFYLLLSPIQYYQMNSYGQVTSSFPIGLFSGIGIALLNMMTSYSANGQLKAELLKYNINGYTISRGETKAGLIGIRSDNYNAIKIKIE